VKALTEQMKQIEKNEVQELNDAQLDQVTGGDGKIETQLSLGSQSSGAGAGKVAFNPFSITRKVDKASPTLFSAG
jgi:type VI protein secretion system component Hcp